MEDFNNKNKCSDLCQSRYLQNDRSQEKDQSSGLKFQGRKIDSLEGAIGHDFSEKLSLKSSDGLSSFGSEQRKYSTVKKLSEGEGKELAYSILSQKEKEKETKHKLEIGNPDGTSGEKREVMSYESLKGIAGDIGEVTGQLQAAVKKLKSSDAKLWNDSFDATTFIRRVAKHNPKLIGNHLNEIMESLARHMLSNQSSLVSAMLITAKELALSQKTGFKTALDKVLTIPARPKPISSALIGFIINVGNSTKQFVKDKAVETLAQIKSETAMTDTEWIRCIGKLVENDLKLNAGESEPCGSLKLLSKKGSADVIREQLVTGKINVSEASEVVKILKKLVGNENLAKCRPQPFWIKDIDTHIKKLKETLKTSTEELQSPEKT
ncbi:hypothetical protein [Endozoicomonas sp.]|uniref:hypothetical protein n=1 Tax=Endozoicomonas sp. TaxID=1892382 RepID=UPI0028839532|nr:hypothetical protein [Endozoicomonas sp.]